MKFVSISSLQKTTKPMLENEVVCVLKNSEPAFYTVSIDRMEELLKYESVAKMAVSDVIKKTCESMSFEGKSRG